MLKVGITGSFGSGKSTVAGMFKRCGAKVVDADAIVHRLLKNDSRCLQKIREAFGQEFVTKKGADRLKLARLVFADSRKLKKLEKILHPLAWDAAQKAFQFLGEKSIVVIDAPLLIESGWHNKVDKVIVVKARIDQQVLRIKKRMGLGRNDVLKRIRRQMPLNKKLSYADFVVDNQGPKTDTYRQVKEIFRKI
ncbi:MAG: dephospho-CoA kinase [Candidatus Omnitrophica bacterium]|nr:dephospho-CoA kinase [Candidatus Omnitrophota bacterium]